MQITYESLFVVLHRVFKDVDYSYVLGHDHDKIEDKDFYLYVLNLIEKRRRLLNITFIKNSTSFFILGILCLNYEIIQFNVKYLFLTDLFL